MKKVCASLLVLALMTATLFTGAAFAEEKKLSVVTTIFPIYDWVREVAGEKLADIDLTLMLDNGVDLHSYQPTAQDILTIANSDLFIYVGGESDAWVEDVLNAAPSDNLRTISLVEAMGEDIKMEEEVEGMEPEVEEDEEEEEEADEHVWLSLRSAQKLVGTIADALAEIDTASAEVYLANADAYIEKLSVLDAEYAQAVDAAACKTLLFGDRFPFRYLADDYGLKYYAAFSGCSAETEASFQTIVFLARKVDELHLPAVLTIEGAAHKIAETVVASSTRKDAKILVMNSLQSVTAQQLQQDGVTYLGVMTDNLRVLKEALN